MVEHLRIALWCTHSTLVNGMMHTVQIEVRRHSVKSCTVAL